MKTLYIVTAISLFLSAVADISKTAQAFKIAFLRFYKLMGAFLFMLVFVSVVLYLTPTSLIMHYLGKGCQLFGVLSASLIGSIAFMPGFIAYPLAGILLKRGVSYTVIAAFTTTLMMVGVVTFPIEKEILGSKVAVIRNLIGFIIALLVSLGIALFFGEL